jgi:hypothetical protein
MVGQQAQSFDAQRQRTEEEESDTSFFKQKKSLDIITERQSEFSNTNGTSARPGSHRSR